MLGREQAAGALCRLERSEDSEAQLKRALEIDPLFQPAIFSSADIASAEESLGFTSLAYRANPSNPWPIVDFVLGYLELRDDGRAAQWAAELSHTNPDSVQAAIASLNLNLYRSLDEEAVRFAERLLPREQGGISVPSRTLMLRDLRNGKPHAALKMYQSKYPELFSDDPRGFENYSAAIDIEPCPERRLRRHGGLRACAQEALPTCRPRVRRHTPRDRLHRGTIPD